MKLQYYLPETHKYYELETHNKRKFIINGVTKENIFTAESSLVILPTDEVINKNSIQTISFDSDTTVNNFKSLSSEEKVSVIKSITHPDVTAEMKAEYIKKITDGYWGGTA